MTLLDMRTIAFSIVTTDIICLLVILLLWHQSRKRFSGTGFWVFYLVFQTTAVLFVILRNSIPDWISIVLANTLVIAGFILGYMGMGRFVRKKTSQAHNYVLLAAFVCAHTYFTLVQPDLAVRNVNFSLMLLIISFQWMWLLVHGVEPPMRRLTLGVGMVLGAYCLVSIVRIVGVFTGPYATNDYLHSGAFESLVLLSYQVLLILLTYSLVLMVNKRLLGEVETQEEKFAKAFHFSPYAITLTRLSDGQIVEINDGFLNITGYQYAEAIGKTTVDLHLWDKEEDRAAAINELSKKGRVQGKEFQFRKRSGEMITGLFSADVIPINNQKYVLSSISDITERKKAEEGLRESEAKYRNLFENMTEEVHLWQLIRDEAGQIKTWRLVDANPPTLKTWGRTTVDEIRGKTTDEIFGPGATDHYMPVVQKIVTEGIPHTFEDYFPNLDKYFRFTSVPLGDYFITTGADITGIKKTEEALRESENRFRLALRNAPVSVAAQDRDLRYIWAYNQRTARPDQIVGHFDDEIFTPEDAAHVTAIKRRVLEENVEYREQMWFNRPSGRIFLDVCWEPIRDEAGRVTGVASATVDLTPMKAAEEALRESEEKYKKLVKFAPAAIYEMDLQGTQFLSVNEAMCEILRYSREELLSTKPMDIMDQESRSLFKERIEGKLRGEKIDETIEYRIRRKDGEWIITAINVGAITYTNEKPARVVVIGYDVTERKKIEEALRQSEERYRHLVQHAPAGIYEIDFTTGRFTEVNDAMCQILGYTRDELLAMTAFNILDDEGRARFASRIRLGQSGERPNEATEYLVRARGGRLIWALLNVTFRWKDDKIVGATVVAHDITDRKQAEEALKRAHNELETRVQERTSELSEAVQRLRAENIQRKRLEDILRESENQVRFFASQCLTAQETERKRIAGELHDSIAASLSAMKFRIERVADEMRQGNGGPESLQDLTSMVSAINNDVRRIMADLRPSILDDLGIIAAMNWFCREYEKTYSHFSVEKQFGMSEDDVPDFLKTPIFRISQEAMNNITKHSQASHVNLSLRKENNRILLTVQDDGKGFDPEIVKKGMGLSTMRERAQLSGGSFELESTIGKGTIVRVSWPLALGSE